MVSLESILEDVDEKVLNKFRTLYDIPQSDAMEIATETNRWLWLNARLKHDKKTGVTGIPHRLLIHEGMVIIDEYWHTYILDTRLYRTFCQDKLGFFIDHSPSSPGFQLPNQEETELQLNYIWDVLGEDTITKWYEEYPTRYSAEILAKLQKPRRFGQPCEVVQ